jgi:hypothetical protein
MYLTGGIPCRLKMEMKWNLRRRGDPADTGGADRPGGGDLLRDVRSQASRIRSTRSGSSSPRRSFQSRIISSLCNVKFPPSGSQLLRIHTGPSLVADCLPRFQRCMHASPKITNAGLDLRDTAEMQHGSPRQPGPGQEKTAADDPVIPSTNSRIRYRRALSREEKCQYYRRIWGVSFIKKERLALAINDHLIEPGHTRKALAAKFLADLIGRGCPIRISDRRSSCRSRLYSEGGGRVDPLENLLEEPRRAGRHGGRCCPAVH